ncbi:MAG: aminotransferase class III-fold pyridoxal phosphate-dependent enzyme, partial [Chloroflexi bacterium]|nr:aminotransferase class III-fold pyridoxal phosphate-dependent enzyme [Chloroflexota bacterium]
QPLVGRYSSVGEVRGKGLMVGVEIVEPGTTKPSPGRTAAIFEETKRRRLLVGTGGLFGNCFRLAPALTVTADEVDAGCQLLEEAIGAAG